MIPEQSRVTEAPLVPDELRIEVPIGGRALMVSDLQLEREASTASTSVAAELALAVQAWTGPGALVFNGDLFELRACEVADPAQALAAHPRLVAAVEEFRRGEGRHVVVLPGSRDAELAWDEKLVRLVGERLGAEVALAAELHMNTGGGERVVRVEPGHRFDPRNAPSDPRNPADTPLGHHLVREVLPAFGPARASWLRGIDRLRDSADVPRFVASRLAYRRLARYLPWLVVPFLVALVLKGPIVYALGGWPRRALTIGATTLLDLTLVTFGVYLVTRRAWSALSGVALGERGLAQNDAARDEARALVTAGGAGLVTAHSHRPELTHLRRGFYANCGCATEVVDELGGRLGLPPVFLARRELSWVELEAGAELHVRLLRAVLDLPDGSLLERLLARREEAGSPRPVVVATFPQGESWPPVADPGPRLRRVRRAAATAIALAGALDLGSALTPPLRERLGAIERFVPLAVPQAATALVAFAGLGLLLLARGVRRGQRRAWSIALALLAGSALLHLVKGIDLEEAAAALIVIGYLLRHRAAFRAGTDHSSVQRLAVTLAGGAVGATALATIAVETFHGRAARVPLGRAVVGVVERLVGVTTTPFPERVDDFVTPSLLAIGVGLVVLAGWLAFRPVVQARISGSGLAKAREIVARHGRGTLDYFALRSDKRHFFSGDSLVAYAVYSGVCLVSPDPIGPEAEHDQAWDAFRRFADEWR
jgi:hypothetical protein